VTPRERTEVLAAVAALHATGAERLSVNDVSGVLDMRQEFFWWTETFAELESDGVVQRTGALSPGGFEVSGEDMMAVAWESGRVRFRLTVEGYVELWGPR